MASQSKALQSQAAFQSLLKLQAQRIALVETVEKIDLTRPDRFPHAYYRIVQQLRRLHKANLEAEALLRV